MSCPNVYCGELEMISFISQQCLRELLLRKAGKI